MLITNIGVLVGSDGGDTLSSAERDEHYRSDRKRLAPHRKRPLQRFRLNGFMSQRQNRENCVSTPRADIYSRRSATPTHIVYAGSREREFIDKINGLSYEEIANAEAAYQLR